MNCVKCNAPLEDGARFCHECGSQQDAVNSASAYAPPTQEPVYAPPVYEPPPAPPAYEPPAPPQGMYSQSPYDQTVAVTRSQEPAYTPPAYAPPPQEPAYTQPAYTPPPAPPPAQPYSQNAYGTPPGGPPQGAGYGGYPGYTPPGSPPPPKKGGGSKLLAIIIPVAAVVVILLALFVLELTRVIDIFPNWPAPPPSSVSERERRERDEEEEDPVDPSESPSDTPINTPPIQTPPPTHTPPPTIPPADTISSNGGSVRVNGPTEFSFTPSQSGVWSIVTSDCGSDDPYLELYNSRGILLESDDDGGEGYNASIITTLTAGETYLISAGFYGDGAGSYMLTVSQAQYASIPGSGDSIRVQGTTRYTFSPNSSGTWDIYTTDNGSSDPILELWDMNNNMLDTDDDSGDGYNAFISAYLDSSQTYIIVAKYYGNDSGSYTLNVRPSGGGPITPPPGSGDISGYGGEVYVYSNTTYTFTPLYDGVWAFFTSQNANGEYDPILELSDRYGNTLSDDDSAGGYNALIVVWLSAGEPITINAMFYGGGSGSYLLHVQYAEEISSSGGTYRVEGPTGFIFTPNRSATWEFLTGNEYGDPLLMLFDVNTDLIADDDDSGGGYNAMISVYLNGNDSYFILARFYGGETGSYDLRVSSR